MSSPPHFTIISNLLFQVRLQKHIYCPNLPWDQRAIKPLIYLSLSWDMIPTEQHWALTLTKKNVLNSIPGKYVGAGLLKSGGVNLWMYRNTCWSNSLENRATVDLRRADLRGWMQWTCRILQTRPIPLRQPFHAPQSRSLRSLSVAGKVAKLLKTAATLWSFGSKYSPLASGALPVLGDCLSLENHVWLHRCIWFSSNEKNTYCPNNFIRSRDLGNTA